MKRHLLVLTMTFFCLGLAPVLAQLGQVPNRSQYDAAMTKLFGDDAAFTPAVETQIQKKSGDTIILPGRMAFDAGKSRIEINVSEAQGLKMPPGAAEQMKAMGFDHVVTITLPGSNSVCIIYPGLHSYMENPMPAGTAGRNQNFKVTLTELGKETLNGHPCVENKALVIDDKGATNEFTVWNATDLKKFPVKIVHTEQDTGITLLFSDVSQTKPAAAAFTVPAGYKHYDSMQSMMQEVLLKKMGGLGGTPLPAQQ